MSTLECNLFTIISSQAEQEKRNFKTANKLKRPGTFALYLHSTSTKAVLDVSFPTLLLATHLYSPLFTLLTFVIIKCRLPFEKLILESPEVVTSIPLNFHVIVRELPEELQNNVSFSPSLTVTVSGCNLVEGFSVREQKYFSQLFGIPRYCTIFLLRLLSRLAEV